MECLPHVLAHREYVAPTVLLKYFMNFNSPRLFDETKPAAWRFGSILALVLSVFALRVSPEFSLINLALSLSAGVLSLLVSLRLPRGIFAAWIVVVGMVWLSPFASASPEMKRLMFSIMFILFSLGFQGAVAIYLTVLTLALGFALPSLSSDFASRSMSDILTNDSFQFLQVAIAIGVSILFVRISHTRTARIESTMRTASEDLEKARAQLATARDSVQITREKLLGPTSSDLAPGAEFRMIEPDEALVISPSQYASAFEDLISTLRKSFSEFQTKGRAEGRISGPIRFVFFAPVGGYDEKSVIAVDLAALVSGLDACLNLALESLPEIGARKREGVVRLSIRYGLRVIEIVVEDNGRGLATRNAIVEDGFKLLKELTLSWGGKFDRLARLGVGSRTSLELRIVRERTRVYRTTLKHDLSLHSRAAALPRA